MLNDEWYRIDVHLSSEQRDILKKYAESKGFYDWEDADLIVIAINRGIEKLK